MNRIAASAGMVSALCVLAGCVSGSNSHPGAAGPGQGQYGSYTQAYTVPWADSPNFSDLTTTLKVNASVNGKDPKAYVVDTGSVGMAVPAADAGETPPDSPDSLTYNSSGVVLHGKWMTLPVSFPVSGTEAARATVPVLVVTSSECLKSGVNSSHCEPNNPPHMLGVGFGRDTTAQASPAYNPLLNLTEMVAGTMRRGYIIGRGGLSLGLTGSDVTGTWTMQSLTNAGPPAVGTHNDWQTPAGGFQVGTGPAQSGTALIDTGIADMIIEDNEPGSPSTGTVAAGTSMTITLGSVSYSFTVGDGGPQTPTSVKHARFTHGAFVNTGRRALGHYDLLFDADGGYLGLRAT
jgi:hypothetical protein